MESVIAHAAETYWGSVQVIVDETGTHERQPQTDEEWEQVWTAGLSIAESGNLLMMAPRVYLAMSADGLFPAALAALSPVTGAPISATTMLALIASLLVALGTFEQVMAFLMCATLGFIALAAAGQLVVRRRQANVALFRAPGSPYTAVLFVALLVLVVAIVAVNRPFQAIVGIAVVLLGLAAYEIAHGPWRSARRKTQHV